MHKILINLFLILSLVILSSCDSATTPTKPTPSAVAEKQVTETNKEASGNTPKPVENTANTNLESNKTSIPTPTLTNTSNSETSLPQSNTTKASEPVPSKTPEVVTNKTNNNKNNKDNKDNKDNKKQAEPTKTPAPQPVPSKTPEIVTNKNNKDNKKQPEPVDTKKQPEPSNNADQATSVFRAIDVVLGRKPSGNDEKANATKIVKNTLAVKEFKNARSKRNDPNLLKDRYPKNTQLKVGQTNQVVFWTAYDRIHFAARHLMDYFDTQDVKGKNSWWPVGTTMEQVDQYLQTTVETYSKQIYLPDPGKTGSDFKYFDFDLQLPNKNRLRVSVGITSEGRVTSFFPKTGNNVISLSETDLQKLLKAVGR